jgi:hypothetical protein
MELEGVCMPVMQSSLCDSVTQRVGLADQYDRLGGLLLRPDIPGMRREQITFVAYRFDSVGFRRVIEQFFA